MSGLYLEGLIYVGKFALQNRFRSLLVGSKFMFYSTVFALFYFVLEGFSKYKPTGAYIQRGNLVESILCCEFEGLILGILR